MSSSHSHPADLNLIKESIGPYLEGQDSREKRGEIYKALLGFVPPRIQSRFAVTGALDPERQAYRRLYYGQVWLIR